MESRDINLVPCGFNIVQQCHQIPNDKGHLSKVCIFQILGDNDCSYFKSESLSNYFFFLSFKTF